jgi:TolB-like protein/cytochrome c-type biogenesis protein CcmH/NrfG
MADESKTKQRLEIAHVLFMDIVGYSKLLTDEQSEALQELNQIVRNTETAREAEAAGQLTILPTGDGMALVFTGSVEEPAECALEISHALRAQPSLPVRMGIHSGPVHHVKDANERDNIAGVGINIAQRVMDCGDAGHILVSKRVADDLAQQRRWQPYLHELGDVEVKHGVVVSLVNLYAETIGNPTPPARFGKIRGPVGSTTTATRTGLSPLARAIFIVAVLLLLLGIASVIFAPAIMRSLGKGQVISPPQPPAIPSPPSFADAIKSDVAKKIHDELQSAFAEKKKAEDAAKADGGRPGGPSLPVPDKSIAVLPFENLSDDKSNAYFAEGIQDEILTRLSKIAALKVISRTSTQKYKSAPDNLREVGQQLGVANLLEGSVQKIANAVHVNVQLIRCSTDEHLWAESYNRKLDDVFGVEGEVATAIADQLNARLSQSEQKAVTAKPTQNAAAYDAYLRGVAFQSRVDGLRTNWVKSAEAFAEAVRLDPDFAVGWAQLARQESLVYNSVNHSPDHQAAARKALDKAIKLGPDLVETKIAQGWYQSYVEADYGAAAASLEQVRRQYPNNSSVSEVLAAVLRRQGHWEESRRLFDQTIELDPRNVFLLANAALAGLETRDPAYTQKYMRRALDLSPQNATLVSQLAVSYQMSGDIKQAQTVLDSVQPQDGDSFYFGVLANNAIYLRDYQPAIATFQSHLKNLRTSDSYFPNYENYLADLQRHSGNIPAATTIYRKAKADAEELLRSQPKNADLLDTLAWAETWLGDKSSALKHAREAVVLMPASKEPRVGPSYEDTFARIQAQLGEKDAAITALQHLLVTSYSSPVVTPALLRLDPDWDNLRGDPRFEKLCQEPAK